MNGKAGSKQCYEVETGFMAIIITTRPEHGGRLLLPAQETAF